MWVKLGVCGVLLVLAGQLLASVAADDHRVAQVRELRTSGGVEVVGTAVALVQREQRTRTRRTTRVTEYTCPEYEYRVDGERYTYTEYDVCDGVEIDDEVVLIHDPARPGLAYNNTEAFLDSQSADRRGAWVMRGLGALVLLGAVWGGVRSGRHRRHT